MNISNSNNTSNTNTKNNSLSTPPSRHPSSGHVSSSLAPAWPFNPAETTLIRAGYNPAYNPADKATSTTSTTTESNQRSKPKSKMAEPRARAPRQKGQMNFSTELRLLLLAYGDPSPHPSYPSEPLPETVRVLDEIVTDFILEMCHSAAQYAGHARRQKIKVDDFRFALRRDENKLGRVQELLRMERELKEARKAFDQNDDQVAAAANLAGAKRGLVGGAAGVGVGGEGESVDGGKKGKGKGKRASAAAPGTGARRGSDATEGTSKKRKVVG